MGRDNDASCPLINFTFYVPSGLDPSLTSVFILRSRIQPPPNCIPSKFILASATKSSNTVIKQAVASQPTFWGYHFFSKAVTFSPDLHLHPFTFTRFACYSPDFFVSKFFSSDWSKGNFLKTLPPVASFSSLHPLH